MATTFQSSPVPPHQLFSASTTTTPRLRSNHGEYIAQDLVGRLRETASSTPLEEMRRRYEEDGYILVKNLIPREDVLDMRQAYFGHLAPTGILKAGTSPREGIFAEGEDPIVHNGVGGMNLPEAKERVQRLEEAHRMQEYLDFVNHPALRSFVREFMKWEKDVLVKRTLLRHNVPHGVSTGIHYDRIFLRAGSAPFLTAWVPIGDCSADGGGLIYLENSDDVGAAMEADFTARAAHLSPEQRIDGFNVNMARDGQLSHDAQRFGAEVEQGLCGGEQKIRKWLTADYEAGDVVFHTPFLIHGSGKNEDKQGRIRLSTDLRFYEEGSDLDARWTKNVWSSGDGL